MILLHHQRRGAFHHLPRRRGLGTVSTQVGGSLIYGSSPVARTPLAFAGPAYRMVPWGYPPRRIIGPMYPIGPTGVLTTPTGTSLATSQALLQSNPSLLTQAQWAQLQAAGLVAGTVPYSSAGQVPSSTNTGVDPATGLTYAQEAANAQASATPAPAATSFDLGAMLQSPVAGLPLYLWLGAGVGAYFIFGRSGKR